MGSPVLSETRRRVAGVLVWHKGRIIGGTLRPAAAALAASTVSLVSPLSVGIAAWNPGGPVCGATSPRLSGDDVTGDAGTVTGGELATSSLLTAPGTTTWW